ncbi:S9 family peptidase [Nibrella saemangeumensis]|uniref:S9 family peptidase n=1 Tax=Nibrella saemangeumensis TaxID=1084526 RepID=A0ABP8N301_9BACT
MHSLNPVAPARLLMRSISPYLTLLISGLFVHLSGSGLAQGTAADYQRAETLREQLKDKVYYAPTAFNWLPDSQKAWYWQQTPKGKECWLVDAQARIKKPAFDQEALAEQLAKATGKPVKPYNLPFTTISFDSTQTELEFTTEGFVWRFPLNGTAALRKKEPVKTPTNDNRYWAAGRDELSGKPVTSPDSLWTAYVRNYNVYIRHRKTKEEIQLSFDGSEGEYYSNYMQWAPDAKKLATYKFRPNTKHLIYFVRSSPEDQLQPKLESREYLKPGDALPVRTPAIFLIDSRKQLPVDNAMFSHQYSLSRPEWRKDSRALTFEYNQRGHQVYRVLEINSTTGTVRPLVEEVSKTFIDYSGKRYRYDVADGKEIIWASERDGWNHLYLYDGLTGKVKKQITKGEWVVRNVIKVDEDKRTILFAASGKNPDQDPYFLHYYRINFDGTGLTALTAENANHLVSFSPDYQTFIDTYSRIDMPSTTVLRSAVDGNMLMELEKADVTDLQKSGWKAPEVFTAKGRDGKTDIWGMIIKPTNFDPTKKYPVIESIYAGPHSSFVPKSFGAGYSYLHQVAELGFIVVQMDGMGTSNRSKAFHDVCWQNLKDAGFPDRILWLKEAARKNSYLDIDRVGIFGTSAGGQSSAGALLFHPDFYKVAVSSCGCHDNRMDKIWWNEQWMGYPIGPHYADCSNVTHAAKLQGKLMLILGEVDDNVDPASTMQLVNALIKANKDFDFVMVPGMNHSSGGDYGERKRRDFFVRHLIGVEPPAWTPKEAAAPISAR